MSWGEWVHDISSRDSNPNMWETRYFWRMYVGVSSHFGNLNDLEESGRWSVVVVGGDAGWIDGWKISPRLVCQPSIFVRKYLRSQSNSSEDEEVEEKGLDGFIEKYSKAPVSCSFALIFEMTKTTSALLRSGFGHTTFPGLRRTISL